MLVADAKSLPPVGELSNPAWSLVAGLGELFKSDGARLLRPFNRVRIHRVGAENDEVVDASGIWIAEPDRIKSLFSEVTDDRPCRKLVLRQVAGHSPPLALSWRGACRLGCMVFARHWLGRRQLPTSAL